jgi:anti-anti-sigma factor
LHGELDCSTVPRLQEAFQEISLDAHAVILDVAGLTFIDSSGVSAILSCWGSARAMRVVEPRGQVRDALARLGLLELLIAVDSDPA